jgi:dTDP-4-amino-4,6-dideoxygalactose transaminase
MAQIRNLCRERNLMLVEDACHAVGARFEDSERRLPHGRMAGALGDIGCFSFFSNKNLVTAEGGVVATDDDDLARKVRLLRSHGMTTLTWDRHKGHASAYDVVGHGYNYRIDEIRAALGRVQLARLHHNNGVRKRLVEVYRQELSDLPGWVVPFNQWRGSSAYHLMTMVAPDSNARQHAAESLREEGVQTSLHYPSIPEFEAFRDSCNDEAPRSRSFASRVLTLPLYPGLPLSQVREICLTVRRSAQTIV